MKEKSEEYKVITTFFLRIFLDKLEKEGLIKCIGDISNDRIHAITQEILYPEPASGQTVNVVEAKQKTIMKAIEALKAQNKKATVREVAEATGIPRSTVGVYMKTINFV